MDTRLYTVGHSTHSWDEFVEILTGYGIDFLVDIRTIPRSRHNPQFNADRLMLKLQEHDIQYVHLKELGGLRHASNTSVNAGWKNLSFRGFADYMQTPEFARGVEMLVDIMRSGRTVIMCAEVVPWRCHRSLIADFLVIRSIPVEHIMSVNQVLPHKITPWAKVTGNTIIYPQVRDDS